MLRTILLFTGLLLTGCVSLPDSGQQAAVLARQSFDADYQLAITSYCKAARIAPDMANQLADSFSTRSHSEWRQMLLYSAQRRESKERQLASASLLYNRGITATDIEQLFADTLRTGLGVTPVYLSRAEIQGRLDAEWPESSAMMHAKDIAAEEGYDGVLVVYFKPTLSEIAGFPFGYQLTYEASVAARSVEDDQLMYYVNRFYPCDRKVVSSASAKSAMDAMRICEQNIHAEIVDEFMRFAESAGVAVSN